MNFHADNLAYLYLGTSCISVMVRTAKRKMVKDQLLSANDCMRQLAFMMFIISIIYNDSMHAEIEK